MNFERRIDLKKCIIYEELDNDSKGARWDYKHRY